MRKSLSRKTVIIVLALFLTLSVGYALFSETITIAGTATAKGTFDIEPTCSLDIPNDVKTHFDDNTIYDIDTMYPEGGYRDISCIPDGNTVTYSAGFDYPGATKYYMVKFENKGDISAYYDLASEDSLANFEIASKNELKRYDATTNELISTTTVGGIETSSFIYLKDMVLKDANGNLAGFNVDDISAFLIDGTKLRLQPGESMYILMMSTWPKYNYNEDNVKYVATSSLKLDWNQLVE